MSSITVPIYYKPNQRLPCLFSSVLDAMIMRNIVDVSKSNAFSTPLSLGGILRTTGLKAPCGDRKSGHTYGLSRFFSSVSGKTIPSLAFLSLSLVSVKQRRSYPLLMEQIVRGDTRRRSLPETSVRRRKDRFPDATAGVRRAVATETKVRLSLLIKALLRRIDLITHLVNTLDTIPRYR